MDDEPYEVAEQGMHSYEGSTDFDTFDAIEKKNPRDFAGSCWWTFESSYAEEVGSGRKELIFICGHYEGWRGSKPWWRMKFLLEIMF